MTASKTCLVVDDSELIREIAIRIITDLGLEAEGAVDAAEAVEVCREKRPAAVFLDWDLPSMGALDFLREAASLEGDRPAIILCATENDHQQFMLAKAAGAAHHILKPFDKTVLAGKLAEIGLIDHPPAAANA
ncbi:response regulator [Hyphococcus luteus]|uniref:Two-component system response regulator n=1 Tax=Hyphococcus luteus TaxID=2058213 RepID=A0A2S7KAB8_9PROT|nr:response regulator [Marinicaulis flavus]PQA89437.1 two-component system response regulator [Marinicaulis flavus]